MQKLVKRSLKLVYFTVFLFFSTDFYNFYHFYLLYQYLPIFSTLHFTDSKRPSKPSNHFKHTCNSSKLLFLVWFVEQKLPPCCRFKCASYCYEFGHNLLCYLSRTQMFNEPTSCFANVKLGQKCQLVTKITANVVNLMYEFLSWSYPQKLD